MKEPIVNDHACSCRGPRGRGLSADSASTTAIPKTGTFWGTASHLLLNDWLNLSPADRVRLGLKQLRISASNLASTPVRFRRPSSISSRREATTRIPSMLNQMALSRVDDRSNNPRRQCCIAHQGWAEPEAFRTLLTSFTTTLLIAQHLHLFGTSAHARLARIAASADEAHDERVKPMSDRIGKYTYSRDDVEKAEGVSWVHVGVIVSTEGSTTSSSHSEPSFRRQRSTAGPERSL
ncbi:hypothetical protein V8E36_009923 [Tilletia maclaganii]